MSVTDPKQVVVVPEGVADLTRWKASNPATVFLVVQSAPSVAGTPAADHSGETVAHVCDTIDTVLTYAGPAATLIAGPALAPLFVGLLKMGTGAARAMIGGKPYTERWTLERLLADPPAARPTP